MRHGMNSFAHVLKEFFDRQPLRQNQIAAQSGISSQHMSDLLSARRDPSLAIVRSLARQLGDTSGELLDAAIYTRLRIAGVSGNELHAFAERVLYEEREEARSAS